jgi:hypothetical protein
MVSFKGRRPMGKPMGRPMGKPFKKKPKYRKFKKKPKKKPAQPQIISMDNTGMEALYLKSLMDSATPVVVKLTSGELIRGYVKYYDKDTFSFGPSDGSPKLFVRKTGVRYLYEDPEAEEANTVALAEDDDEDMEELEGDEEYEEEEEEELAEEVA